MSTDFNASVVISTTEAVTGLKAVDDAAKNLDATLRNLDTALKNGQTNLDAVSRSMAQIVQSNKALIDSDLARAKATTEAAKADAALATADDKRQKTANDAAIAEAKVQEIQRKGTADALSAVADVARKDAVARDGMDQRATLTAQKVATEAERTAAANKKVEESQLNVDNASSRSQASALRLADAQKKSTNNNLELNDSLSNSRYLLYDVAATYGAVSTALLAIPAATSAVAMSYQKDFAQVLRISDQTLGQADSLRTGLVNLTTALPESFSDVTAIAQLGAHLQLGNDGLVAFTETVAKFAAATGVEVNTASQLFSRMKTSMADSAEAGTGYFNKLGSSIAQMGTVVVATDTEVTSMVTQINAVTASAGIGTAATVGLAGAMASLRIQPEMARGALTRMFATFNRDAADATSGMDKFTGVLGMSAQSAAALWKSDPSAFFNKLVEGLNGAYKGGQNLTLLFDQMGIKNVRDVNTLQRLAVGYDVLTKSMAAASTGYNSGTALDELSKPIFETAAAKLQELGNAFQKLGDVIGSGSMAPLAGLADNLKGIVSGVADFAKQNPEVVVIINTFMALAGVVGVFAAFKAAQSLMLAGMISFQQVLGNNAITAGLTAKGSFMELVKTMLMMKGVNAEVAQSFISSTTAMKAFGTTAMLTKEQVAAANAGTLVLGETAATSGGKLATFGTGIKGVGSALLGMVGGPIGVAVIALGVLGAAWAQSQSEAANAGDAMVKAAASGGEALKAATIDALGNMKVGLDSGVAAVGNLDKKLIEIARDAGVPFDKIATAALSGKDATDKINAALNEAAKNKGLGSWAEAAKSLDPAAMKFVQDAGIIKQKVLDTAKAYETSTANAKDMASATTKAGNAAGDATQPLDENGNAIDGNATSADKAAKAIDTFVKAIFGITDAQSATQDALFKLGQGMQKSLDMSTATEGGRANLKAFQDVIKNAALEQQQLVDQGKQTVEQASANYGQFIDGLMNQLGSKGANPDQVKQLADNAKNVFNSELQKNNPTLAVKIDASKVDDAKKYLDQIVTKYGTTNLDVIMRSGGSEEVAQNVSDLQQYIQAASDKHTPYTFVAKADTSNANKNVKATSDFVWTALGMPIQMHISANVDPATQALQMLGQYAAGVINGIIDGFNNLRNGFDGLFGVKPDQIGHVGWGAAPAPVQQQDMAVPNVPKTPAMPQQDTQQAIDQNNANKTSLDGLGQGYDDVANKAQKAGQAAKQAAKDAADGISEATAAAADYGSRLKTGLTAAYTQQYALVSATDAYHSALNAINKKRADELTQLDDLILKQKTLNDERNTSLIDAAKAGNESAISTKYGETARAQDYANQQQKALDAAAAKEKDIAANNKTIDSLKAGIDNFNGYSDAAIANRAALRDLEMKMLDMISAYATTGASQQQVKAYAQQLTAQFQTDVTQIYHNKTALGDLAWQMDRYVQVANAVPQTKTTTVTANTGDAMGAISALNNALNNATQDRVSRVTVMGTVIEDPARKTQDGQPMYIVTDPNTGRRISNTYVFNKGGQVPGFADGGLIPGQSPSDPGIDNMMASVDGKGMVKVRSGEFIVQQPAVDFWGLDFFKQLNSMKMPAFNSGGAVGGGNGSRANSGGAMLVELTADNIAAILRLADRPVDLYANVEKLASTVNIGNRILASKGVVIG